MKLADTKCKAAKGKDKPYKMADGAGLYLLVNPDGGKYWRMKYYFQGVNKDTGEPKRIEKLLSFGAYPLITLSEAREMRDEAKKRLAKGIDPATEKKQQKRQAYRNAKNSFKAIAEEWYDNQKQRWSDNHYNTVKRRLEKDVFPEIGNMPINSIEPPDLLDALRKIEKRGALDVAGRVKQICGQVFRYGIQTGRCTRNPTSDLQGALKIRKTEHFAALDIKEIPEFLHALETNEARLFPRTRRAIKLSMLTFVRPSELRQAQWDEIDLEAKEWIIPAEKIARAKDLFEEYTCPHCSAFVVERHFYPIFGWVGDKECEAEGEYIEYECGYITNNDRIEKKCPHE